MYNKFMLTVIASCAMAFIYFEYKPEVDLINKVVQIETPDQRLAKDPRCFSNKFTAKFKREVIECQ